MYILSLRVDDRSKNINLILIGYLVIKTFSYTLTKFKIIYFNDFYIYKVAKFRIKEKKIR